MELALWLGKWIFLALIYLFVFMVYRGLIRQRLTPENGSGAREPRSQALRRPAPSPGVARPVIPPQVTPLPVPAPRPLAPPPVMSPALREALEEEPTSAQVLEVPHVPAAQPLPLPLEAREDAPARAALTVIHSETPEIPVGREYPLMAAATLGRGDYNLVALPDQFVSLDHAVVFLQDGRRVLRDRNSTNGTLLNGRKVTADIILQDGDQITVGTTILKYSEPDSHRH